MPRSIAPLTVPEVIRPHLGEFSALFPDKVTFDHESHEVVLKEAGTFEFQVACAFVRLATEAGDVVDNLNIVLSDMTALATSPPPNAAEGERRYTLLTRLFFYELLRLRDSFPRFLSRMEALDIMEKSERHETRKLFDRQLSEHYLIRNVYLHGHSVPRSPRENLLKFVSSLPDHGYEAELQPRDGRAPIRYKELLVELATSRCAALHEIGRDLLHFIQTTTDASAIWTAHHKLSAPSTGESDA